MVVLDPANGELLASVSQPAPEGPLRGSEARFAVAEADARAAGAGARLAGSAGADAASDPAASPFMDRARFGLYPPGSTFKVVTAIAAIDSGQFTPNSTLSGRSPQVFSGTPLANFANEQFGDITLTQALTDSVNTVWAQVGEKLGKRTMKKYMTRLGFDRKPPIDLPTDELRASGEYLNGRLISPTSRYVDVARMAIGQDKLAVTPLEMAMVAATVANGGELMAPHITDRIVDRDGRTVQTIEPKAMSRVMSAKAAGEVNGMMQQVVREGTGTAAALAGIDVAGKTGTAEVDRQCGPNQLWFIGFAPANNPRVAIATTVECGAGTGGVVAAPIAKAVMQELLK